MSLTVRSARSFYERSQRTGPDDLSEIKCAGLPTPPRKRAYAGRRPSCPVPHCDTGSNTGDLGLKQMQGDASNPGEVSEAEPCPEIFPIQSASESTSGRSVFAVLWGGPPGPRGASRPRPHTGRGECAESYPSRAPKLSSTACYQATTRKPRNLANGSKSLSLCSRSYPLSMHRVAMIVSMVFRTATPRLRSARKFLAA